VGDPLSAESFIVFPGSDVQGQAFDNDGVQSVSYKIYNKTTNAFIDEGTKNNVPLVEGDPPTTFFSWGFTAPEEPNEYKIIIDCKDMYGTAGETSVSYFYVQSTTAPSVTLNTPDINISLFGNAAGDFTISGITGDGSTTGPSSLKMVWLNPTDKTGSRFNYQSATYEGWNTATPAGAADSAKNIVWEMPLTNIGYDDINKRYTKSFSMALNLFTKLNIGSGEGKNPLTSQIFVFFVKGGNNMTAIKSFSFKGDIEQPSLTIDTIDRTRTGSTETFNISTLTTPGNSMTALQEGDVIKINGTWSDDSFTKWNDLSKMVKYKVSWTSKEADLNLTADGKWTATFSPLTGAEAQAGSVYLTAKIGDYGGNIAEKSVSFKVDTVVPVLMYVTCAENDGYYNAAKTINIELTFNKAVEFTGSATKPYISLNSGANVELSTTGSQTIHRFAYTVAAGNSTGANKLIVNSINLNGNTCKGTGGTAVLDITGRNLDRTKAIYIDTAVPSIARVYSLSGSSTSYFNKDKSLYLVVEFNEDIKFTPGTDNGTSLTLNSNYNSSGSPVGNVYAISPEAFGNKSLMFTYTVADNQNTPFTPPNTYTSPLTASAITKGSGAAITDLAGNDWTAWGSPTNISSDKTIYIDTTAPATPTLTTPNPPLAGTFKEKSFTVTGTETGAKVEFSANGTGGPWLTYTDAVNLTSQGTFNVTARQTDQAGNVSANAGVQTVTIKPNDQLVSSFSGTPKTYKLGETIEITVNFRGAVTTSITSGAGIPTLTLGGGTGTGVSLTSAAADYYSGSGSSAWIFRYTVKAGDNVPNALTVTAINRNNANITEGTANVNSEFIMPTLSLDSYTTIKIDTLFPAFTTATVSGTTLTLNYNKPIYKGTGNITINYTDAADRRAPSVLTKTEYLRYGGAGTLSTYYTVGTNGTNASGNPDTTEKYILNYNLDNTNATLITALDGKGAFTVTIPVLSGAVTVSGSSLNVNLSETYGYVLPVKGVSYTVSYLAGLVQDTLGNQVAARTGITVTNPGVNAPVIRVEKKKESFKSSGTVLRPDISVTETSTPIPPSGYWIKNADIKISKDQPAIAGNWVKVDRFTVNLGWGENIDKTGIVTSNPTSSLYIEVPTTGLKVQGNLYSNGSNLGMEWYLATPTWTQVNNYWVNPYVRTIIQGDRANTGDFRPLGDNNDGYFVWVNTSTSGASTSNDTTPAGVGWLRVTTGTGGGATYNTTVTVGAYTTQAVSSLTAEQPLTAGVKIDCQTPDATISYRMTQHSEAPFAGPFTMGDNPNPNKSFSMPTATTGTSGAVSTFDLGEAENLNGYLYGIRAVATKGGVNSDPSYEKAARSVVMFNNIAGVQYWSDLVTEATGAANIQLWIRGGDDTSGSSLTPGFPLAWSDKDYGGIRCLTNAGADTRYWVTWEVNTPAYFHFLAGRLLSTDDTSQGPSKWSWTKNSWSLQHSEYPLYPGGCLLFYPTTRVSSPATATLEFYHPFSGSR